MREFRQSPVRLLGLRQRVSACAHVCGRPLAILLGLLLIGGCAGTGSDDASSNTGAEDATAGLDETDAGRQLFQTTCRACHALDDAKAAGVFGPDLDLLQPSSERVREQISSGGGGMPSELLEGDDADLVAAYVAAVAGRGPNNDDAPPRQRGSTRPGDAP